MSRVANRDRQADGPRTSGMVALMPTAADAKRLAVDGGEDPDQLHLTLAHLGDHATSMAPETQAALHQVVGHLAAETPPVSARVSGHLLFNPDSGPDGDRTPVAAYLVSDSPALAPLHDAAAAAVGAADPDVTQFSPFIPHVSGAYDRDAGALGYAGPVAFDRVRVAIGDGHTDYPLGGSGDDTAGTDPDADGDIDDGTGADTDDDSALGGGDKVKDGEKSIISITELVELAELAELVRETKDDGSSGSAGSDAAPANSLTDGSYQINHPGQLKTAINALTAYQVARSKRAALRRHVLKHAGRLHAMNMVPKSIQDEKDSDDDSGSGKKDAAPAVVDTKDGPDAKGADARNMSDDTRKYGEPVGPPLGKPRDGAAAQAQQDSGAVKACQDLLAGNTQNVEPLDTMDPDALKALTRVAYSYNSSAPNVMKLRMQLAQEMARRGMKVTDFGALGAPAPAGKGDAAATAKQAGKDAAPQAKGDLDAAEVEYKTKYTTDDRRAMAKKGQALPDGTFPIMDRSDLDSAIRLRGRHSTYSTATVVKHIVKRAKAIGATDMLPDGLADGVQEKQLSWDGAPDSFTAGVLLGLSGLDTADAIELKAGPPGHTFPSPDPNAARLREYWVHGKGALKIQWGVPHDFDRCVLELTKYVGDRAKGLCNIYHRSALHVAPGQEDAPGRAVAKAVGDMAGSKKSDGEGAETKALTGLWVPDPAAVDGWRAYAPAWPLDDALIAEMKALRPNKTSGGYVGADDDEQDTGSDSGGGDASADDTGTDAGTDDSSDDDVLAALDNYAAMVPQVSPEAAYMQAIGDQIPWQLAATGDLVNPDSPGGEIPVLQREEEEFGETGPSDAIVDDLSGTDVVPDADNAGGDDTTDDGNADELTFPDEGDLFDPDDAGEVDDTGTNADEGDTTDTDDTGGADDAEGNEGGDTGAAIPEVAELLAALMAEQDAVEAPPDDDDAGEAEEDSEGIGVAKRPAAATA